MRAGISRQKTLKTTAKSAAAALGLGLSAALANEPAPGVFSGPIDAGLMAEPREREASGLAPSRRTAGVYWTHNDSGAGPVVFAVDSTGGQCGRLRLAGVDPEDWEDMASFELAGRAFLLLADCGDNFANRPRGVLHVVPEPEGAELSPGRELIVAPAYSIHFTFEDGARDCEAVGVDAAARIVWLVTKRDVPARIYQLPLAPAGADQPAVARFAGLVAGTGRPDEFGQRVASSLFSWHQWPTALDFSPDGRLALLLNLDTVLLFPRRAGETWAEALARPPVALAEHKLPQAEAACFSADGRRIVVCSEGTRRWLRYDRAEPWAWHHGDSAYPPPP